MNLLYRCTPWLLGLVFLFSGTYKVLHPSSAILALRALDIPSSLGSAVILIVTVLELYLGILLITRVSLRYAMTASTGLLLGFSLFLFYLSLLAHPPACGCMGLTAIFRDNRHNALLGLFRNCVMLWLLRASYGYYFPARNPQKPIEAVVCPSS